MGVDDIKGDLHIHTYLSDGSCSIERIFQLAQQTGLEYISITDHDHIEDASRDHKLCEQYGVKMIHGVELSAQDFKHHKKVHILCYMPEFTEELQEICKRNTARRGKDGKQMAELVTKKYPITVEDIQLVAKHSDCLFKQHIMQALIESGYATKIFGGLYEKLCDFQSENCEDSEEQVDVYEVLAAVKRSGGITVLAHPYTYDSIDFLNEILQENYLDGIEVWSSKSNKEQESYLLEICKNHNLIPTGGSDFHGAYSSRVSPIGVKSTPEESIIRMLNLKNKVGK